MIKVIYDLKLSCNSKFYIFYFRKEPYENAWVDLYLLYDNFIIKVTVMYLICVNKLIISFKIINTACKNIVFLF